MKNAKLLASGLVPDERKLCWNMHRHVSHLVFESSNVSVKGQGKRCRTNHFLHLLFFQCSHFKSHDLNSMPMKDRKLEIYSISSPAPLCNIWGWPTWRIRPVLWRAYERSQGANISQEWYQAGSWQSASVLSISVCIYPQMHQDL